jgi:hypothetical protein
MILRQLITSVLSASFCLPLLAQAGEIYKTVDEQGRVIYSDRPSSQPGERVTLPPVNTLPSDITRPASGYPPSQAREPAIDYQVRIVSPQDNATVPPGQRDLAIAVSLNRPLHRDHLLMFMMDGEPLEETRNNSVVVREITRGAHSLHVEVIDARGNTLTRSGSITVNVHRPSVINRPAN